MLTLRLLPRPCRTLQLNSSLQPLRSQRRTQSPAQVSHLQYFHRDSCSRLCFDLDQSLPGPGHRRTHVLEATRNSQKRWQHYYYRKSDSYTRFQQSRHVFSRWRQRPTFWYEVGGLGVLVIGFYEWNVETVPVSGRRRFNIISPNIEKSIAQQQYQHVMQQYRGRMLPNYDPRTRMVRNVLQRLIPAVGMDDLNWEVYVIDSEETNAFVIPGGKVFVFTGLLPIANNPSRVATVLAHEIAHTLARHTAERLSSSLALYMPLIWACYLIGIPDLISQLSVDLVLSKPGSRTQEAEADYIGMMLMAQACFEPQAAVELWEGMERAERLRGGGAPPQFLSTHPSNHNRIARVKEWLPEARQKQAESDCSATLGYANEFRRAFGGHAPW